MEKLIYVHMARFGESLKEGLIPGSRDATNDWYVIKRRSDGGGDGVEMSRVFEDAGQLNHPDLALLSTACVVIGSHLYVIGGRCFMCKADYNCEYKGSAEIRCLDTRNPQHGWRTCFTLPFTEFIASSAVVDDQWLYLFPYEDPWCYGFNVYDGKSVRKVPKPGNCTSPPFFSTCLSPGTLVAYKRGERTLYQLDCKNSAWSVYHKDFLPYSAAELRGCPTALDDGILYIYITHNMRLISFDIRNKKELHAVDLPRTVWLGRYDAVDLFVLSKNRFCIVWHRRAVDINESFIYYSRFSVSYHLPHPTVVVEETHSFPVVGTRFLNVVAVDPHADVDMAGGEKPI